MEHTDIISGGINFTKQLKKEGFEIIELSNVQILFYNPSIPHGFLYDYKTTNFTLVEGEELDKVVKLKGEKNV